MPGSGKLSLLGWFVAYHTVFKLNGFSFCSVVLAYGLSKWKSFSLRATFITVEPLKLFMSFYYFLLIVVIISLYCALLEAYNVRVSYKQSNLNFKQTDFELNTSQIWVLRLLLANNGRKREMIISRYPLVRL